jgi:hypothetical protein
MPKAPVKTGPELPEAAAHALTEKQRELAEMLRDPKLDADAIASRLLANADHNQTD